MFKADKNTLILFLGGMKKNIADHRISCRYNHYEVNDSSLSRYEFSGGVPEVILCLGGFISHPSFNKWKEKATTFKIPLVVGGSGLGSLVEQAKQQNIDLSDVIKVNGRPTTSEIAVVNGSNPSNGSGNGTMNMLLPEVRPKDMLPKHYDWEFRDKLSHLVKMMQVNDQLAVLYVPGPQGYTLHIRGRLLEEADRLATKFGCDGNDPSPLKRFVMKDVAEKIVTEFNNKYVGGRGFNFDYITIRNALNTYRRAETPDRFKKTKRKTKMKQSETSHRPFPAPVAAPAPTPAAPTPAATPAPAPTPTPTPNTDNSSIMSALIDNPSGADKIGANVDERIEDLSEVLREIRGKIQKRRSISGSTSLEVFLTEMVLHFRDEDETKRELIQLFKEFANLRSDHAKLRGEYELLMAQWSEATDQLKIKIKELDTNKEEIKKWKALASQS